MTGVWFRQPSGWDQTFDSDTDSDSDSEEDAWFGIAIAIGIAIETQPSGNPAQKIDFGCWSHRESRDIFFNMIILSSIGRCLRGVGLGVLLGSMTSEALAENYVLAIHGGAGTLRRSDMTPERVALYEAALRESLAAGQAVLAAGGTAREAVIRAVESMEDSELFNAGRGAVFTAAATHELDAALMDGKDRRAGAVSMVRTVRHPVRLAEAVMETTPHVLMVGDGAEAVADAAGLERVENAWFSTPVRRQQLERLRALPSERMILSEDVPNGTSSSMAPQEAWEGEGKFGTVGAVALDRHGNLAAATSTGGMTNKRAGRVGDSPLIGAGTWADNATCAVSCTGTGEVFIRANAAADVGARMAYGGRTLAQAAHEVIHESVLGLGGRGGLIAVDAAGNVALEFNTPGMYRGSVDQTGEVKVAIYRDEP